MFYKRSVLKTFQNPQEITCGQSFLINMSRCSVWLWEFLNFSFQNASVSTYIYRKKYLSEATFRRCSSKQVFLKIWQYSQENTISRNLFLNKVSDLRPPTQVFSCEYCEIFKNSFFIEHLQWLLLTFQQTTGVKVIKPK